MAKDAIPVRQSVELRATGERGPLDRFVLRFPAVAALLSRAVLRLSPRSPLRRVAARHIVRMVFESANRGDYEVTFALIERSRFELETPPELVALGFEPSYHGREGRLAFQLRWVEELQEFQQEDAQVIDCGDRLVLLARMRGTGLSSGAVWDSEVSYVLTVSRGVIVREQTFRSHQQGLEAAGLVSAQKK